MNVDKQGRYLKALYMYGFITLLYLLNEYKDEENYEECQLILNALTEHNLKFGTDLPTELNDAAIEYYIQAIQEHGFSGEISLTNVPYYAEEVKKIVNI